MRSPASISFPTMQVPVKLALTVAAVATAACSSNTTSPGSITAVSGGGQTAMVATGLGAPLEVQVKDQNGSPLSGVQVSFAPSGTEQIATMLATTDASGDASTTVTAGTKTGTDTIYAWVQSVASPATFLVTATPGAAASVVALSGNEQTATAGTTLINGLVVQVLDQYGNGVPGASIDWSTTAGTLTATAAATTDPNGLLTEQLQLPSTPGSVTVTATVHGTQISTTFGETAD